LNLYTYVHNNPLINVDPSGHIVESAELFNVNWLINEQKKIWQDAFENNDEVGMNGASNEAKRLRSENNHLTGLLKSTDKLQLNRTLEYGKYVIARKKNQVQLEIRVRIDKNDMIYYSLPSNSISLSEDIYVQGELAYYSSKVGKHVIDRTMEVANEFGGSVGKGVSYSYFNTLGNIDVPPIGETTTMTHFEQNGTQFNGSFTTHNQKIIRFDGWRSYTIFRGHVPK
jgi:hypothetical protein